MSCVYISWGNSHSLSCCLMRRREKFECLRWHEGQTARWQPQGKVRTSTQKLVLVASKLLMIREVTFYYGLGFERSCCGGIRKQKPKCEKPACFSGSLSKVHPKPGCYLKSCLNFCFKVWCVFIHFTSRFSSDLMLHLRSWAVKNVEVYQRRPPKIKPAAEHSVKMQIRWINSWLLMCLICGKYLPLQLCSKSITMRALRYF